jgi:DNA (cytosine-5)-methyltransferase 1
LDAANYGVPQHRERLFLLGAKKGMRLPAYPGPKVRAADAQGDDLFDLPIGPTCADALGDLPDADGIEDLIEHDCAKPRVFGAPSKYAAELRCLTNQAWHYGQVRDWDSSVMTSSWRTDHTAISRRRFGETPHGETEPISRFFKLSPVGLSNTLRAGTDGARGAFTSPRPIHYLYPRCVTVREMARLHGFPDWFRLHSTKWHGARQIGNSVPPPLARVVADEVMKALEARPVRPRGAITLGDPALLYMDTREAAAKFEVIPPSTRRDKKSGAKKRKQVEIEALRRARAA